MLLSYTHPYVCIAYAHIDTNLTGHILPAELTGGLLEAATATVCLLLVHCPCFSCTEE